MESMENIASSVGVILNKEEKVTKKYMLLHVMQNTIMLDLDPVSVLVKVV